MDPILLGLKFFGHGLFLDQDNFFDKNNHQTLMGFDTIEVNLVKK